MPIDVTTSDICEQAFLLLELGVPSDFGTTREESVVVASAYDRALKLVLEAYDWSCAREIVALAAADPAPTVTDPDLAYAVTLPADCVKLRHIYDGDDFTWRKDGRLIRLDSLPPITIRYTKTITDEADLDGHVAQVVAHQIAYLVSPRFVTSRTKRADLRADLADAMQAAKDADAITGTAHRMDGTPDVGDWVAEATT